MVADGSDHDDPAPAGTGYDPKWKWPRVDPFGISKIGRAHKLTVHARHALQTMALHGSYRSHTWGGTIAELADDTGMGTKTAAKAVDDLVKADQLDPIRPFGRGRDGEYGIINHHLLVNTNSRYQPRQEHEPDQRVASRSRRSRVGVASFDASDQGESRVSQVAGRREGFRALPAIDGDSEIGADEAVDTLMAKFPGSAIEDMSPDDLEHLAHLKRQEQLAKAARTVEVFEQPALGHYRRQRDGTDSSDDGREF